ncbi:hypothetical protein ACFVHB_26465 [Kitasatospora sp. NPDC127111]|uniref:hypothetical protein n=1 Tax=Kitasatospora sp. NPDC127111 TaxID=3345363 RepID=UPI003641F64A
MNAPVTRAAGRRHRLARPLANALDPAGGAQCNADTDFDVRRRDVPLNDGRPDVVVHRADSSDIAPTGPEHVVLVVEVVPPGSETTALRLTTVVGPGAEPVSRPAAWRRVGGMPTMLAQPVPVGTPALVSTPALVGTRHPWARRARLDSLLTRA